MATETIVEVSFISLFSVFFYFFSLGSHLMFKYLWLILSYIIWFPTFMVLHLTKYKLTLSFSTFVVICAIITYAIYCLVKGRVLSQYKKLTPDFKDAPQVSQETSDTRGVDNDNDDEDDKQPLSYLDQFLSAIKVFGYLEKPVFHDLTKNMRTQKLDQGEILLLDNDISFAIVVEGTLQIYHEVESSANDTTDDVSSEESYLENDNTGYIHLKNGLGKFQLLNTVKPGNPVSSLATILSLFTSTIHTNSTESSRRNSIQKQLVDYSMNGSESPLSSDFFNLNESMPNIVAMAATDCTIAIIPPQAFANLSAKYPRSVSHIIQMVLTKLYHVTFQTVHQYLGLTNEIMQIENQLNKSVNYELPYYLKEVVTRKLDSELQNSQQDNNIYSRPSSSTTERNSLLNVTSTLNKSHNLVSSRHVVLDSRDHLNPGDLLSNVPLSRKEVDTKPQSSPNNEKTQTPPPLKIEKKQKTKDGRINGIYDTENNKNEQLLFAVQHDETVESTVKLAIAEAMFTYLGINKKNMSIAPPSETLSGRPSDSSLNNTSIANLNKSFSHHPSDVSILSSLTSSSHQRNSLRILPSDFVLNSSRDKNNKKRPVYKEEVSPSLDYEFAKNEFAEGIQLKFFKQGSTIVEQDHNGKGLFYIIKGKIDVTIAKDENNQFFSSHLRTSSTKKTTHTLFTIDQGGIAGFLSCLVNYRSFANLKAKTDVYVGFLPNNTIERLCDKYFQMYLRLAETLISLLSPRMLKLDHALEWIHLSASDTLFHQGDPANGIYVVLSGRLRQFQKKELENGAEDQNNNIILGELAQDESFGELEVLTATNRSSTILAVRDSELARIPRTLFEALALEHPSIMIRVSRLVAKKLLSNNSNSDTNSRIIDGNGYKYDSNLTIPATKNQSHIHKYHESQTSYPGTTTYRTITILPITDGLPVENFATKLVQAFKQVGRTTIGLNQRTTLTHLGRHAFDRLAKLKQSGYFAELEQTYQTVVYIADPSANSSWTKTCITQGDCVLLLADAYEDAEIGEYEKLLLKSKTTARTELILLHPERNVEPGLTQKWLRTRPWVDSHHHIQFTAHTLETQNIAKTDRFGALSLLDRIIQTEISRKTQHNISKLLPVSIKATVENFSSRFMGKKRQYYTPIHTYKNDFLRLARILSGQAIGLVLGGGGAKGISHLGVLQALEERGIPIDMVGGTSIGSFVGGLYAKDYNILSIFGRTKKFSGRIASFWRMATDLTWPVTSYTTGHEFNRGIWKTFGDTRIEDFWLQFYCNSTNITESVQEIHSFGYAWRYIRASMSLAGLLPPLEENGSMLLDGGYVDNLPVLEMRARGCKTIFAVDVGSVDDRTLMNYGDSLNGFWIIFNRWNPFSKHPNIPNMAEIQVRLGYVASVNALEKAKHMKGVIYARPPIDNFNTLDFSKFEDIYQLGLHYGRTFFQELNDDGRMPFIPGTGTLSVESEVPEFLLHRRNSI